MKRRALKNAGLVVAIILGWAPGTAWCQETQSEDEPKETAPTLPSPPRKPPAESQLSAKQPASAVTDVHLLQRYLHEPSVEQVLHAAMVTYRKHGTRLSSLAQRARLRGLIPTLSVSARHGQALDLATSQTSVTDQLRVGTGRDLTLQAALTFELPRLVFAREEISLARDQRMSLQQRQQFIEQVVALYFERRRNQLRRDQGAAADADLHLRILELTALLDAFTDGAFSTMIKPRASREVGAKSPTATSPGPQSQ